MLELSEKLKKFSTEVLGEAKEAGQKKLDEFAQILVTEYDRKETEFLEEGYHTIQSGLKQIDKEKSGRISKAVMENRRRILQQRAGIVNRVFSALIERLNDFTKTEEYRSLLEQRIEKTIRVLGVGPCKIVLRAADLAKVEELMQKYPEVIFEAEAKQVVHPMIGGCRGYHEGKNLFYDNSFAVQVDEQRQRFLQEVAKELKIED